MLHCLVPGTIELALYCVLLLFLHFIKFFGHTACLLEDLSAICKVSSVSSNHSSRSQESSKVNVWGVAVDTFALLASTLIGKKAMMEICPSELRNSLNFGTVVFGQSEVRVHCLQCLAIVTN